MNRVLIIFLIISTILLASNENNSTLKKEYKLFIDVPKVLDKDEIAKILGSKDKGLIDLFSNEWIILEEFLENIDETLKGYLESKGYFDAKIIKRVENGKIYIKIIPNEPIRVEEINIDSDIDIKDIVTWKKGDIFTSDRFSEIKDAIKKRLYEQGYCNSKIETKAYVDLKRHSAKLKYVIKKGKVCYFGKINLNSYPKDIKKDVIYSRLKFKEGDRFDIRKIEESYFALSSINTFANLQIKYELDTKTQKVDTNITLDKKDKLKRYELALGVDSEIGFRVKALWEKRNFLGDAKKITFKTEISKKKQELIATLFAPAIFSYKNNYLDYYIMAGLYKDDNDGYKEDKGYINSYLEYKHKNLNIKAGIEINRLVIDLKEEEDGIIGGEFNIFAPYISLVYDKRDSKLDPKKGYYLGAYGEYGLSFASDNVNYFKYLLEARYIKTFDDLTLSAVGKIGTIHEINGRLPASKLFYGGGLFSNRAYSNSKIGVIYDSENFGALGGKSILNLQLEANYKLYKDFYGAIFLDSTMISQEEYEFSGKRIDTMGFGLRYKTPIGPIKVDVGFNMHNRKDYAISIMLGQSF